MRLMGPVRGGVGKIEKEGLLFVARFDKPDGMVSERIRGVVGPVGRTGNFVNRLITGVNPPALRWSVSGERIWSTRQHIRRNGQILFAMARVICVAARCHFPARYEEYPADRVTQLE